MKVSARGDQNFKRRTGQTGPQKERLEFGGAGEAGGREEGGRVRGGRAHRPCGMEGGGERGRGGEKGFWINGGRCIFMREVLVAGVYSVAIKQRADAVAVEAAT
jgi:hypothetical protein